MAAVSVTPTEHTSNMRLETYTMNERIIMMNKRISDIENKLDAMAVSGENFKETSKERSTMKNDSTDER